MIARGNSWNQTCFWSFQNLDTISNQLKNAVIASLPIHMCNKNECWNYALKLGSSFDTQDVTYANFAMHTSCSHEMPIWVQE